MRLGDSCPGFPLPRWKIQTQTGLGSRSHSQCPAKDPTPVSGADTLRAPSGLQARQEGDPSPHSADSATADSALREAQPRTGTKGNLRVLQPHHTWLGRGLQGEVGSSSGLASREGPHWAGSCWLGSLGFWVKRTPVSPRPGRWATW